MAFRREHIRDLQDEKGFSLLVAAVPDLAIIRYFIEECGEEVPFLPEGDVNQTLLHVTAVCGETDTMRYLVLECGMDTMTLNGFGQTACSANVIWKKGNAMNFFLDECSIDVNFQEKHGFTLPPIAVSFP